MLEEISYFPSTHRHTATLCVIIPHLSHVLAFKTCTVVHSFTKLHDDNNEMMFHVYCCGLLYYKDIEQPSRVLNYLFLCTLITFLHRNCF